MKQIALALSILSAVAATTFAQAPHQNDKGTDMGIFVPTDAPNTPMGVARGIHPGRVAWAFDPKAAAWDGKHGLYSDSENNSQNRVDDMMEGCVIALTEKDNIGDAWGQLFTTFNARKGKGAVGYKPGEKVAIKINLNDNGGSNIIDATPQSVLALVRQLVDVVGVPQECITIYDAQRRGISAVYTYVEPLYPRVNYQNWGGFVPGVVNYSAEIKNQEARSIARAAYEADYMINMALMKRHSQPTTDWKDSAGQTGITATGKNQFGSLQNCSALHYSIRDWSNARGMATYNSIVDLMANDRLGENTLIYLVDAMYVNPKHNGKAVKFVRPPFNNGWTSSFLASNDQVAIESVVLDFINSELPLAANADNFLHEAACIGNPPSKTNYTGKNLVSLGVHEHWNNPVDRRYSRNLGTGAGIELYRVPLRADRAVIETFFADRTYAPAGSKVNLSWQTSNAKNVTLNGKTVEANGKQTVKADKSATYVLEVTDADGNVEKQSLAVRAIKPVKTYKAKDAEITGTFGINKNGDIALSGERSNKRNLATLKIDVPADGTYLLGANYNGTDPAPAIIYVDGNKVTENFGWLSTLGREYRDYYFPVTLTKGKHELQLEMPGRRGVAIRSLSLSLEKQ